MTDNQAKASTPKSKRFVKPLRIILLIIAAAFAVVIWVVFIARPYDKTSVAYMNVTIEEGESLSEVASKLEEQKIIANASDFVILLRLTFKSAIRPGTYYLSPSMNGFEIASTLVNGLTTSNGFTIPDGYNLEQIASALARDGFVDYDKFLEAAASPVFAEIDFIGSDIEEFGITGREQLEGFLLPGEYVINSDADETMMLLTMIDAFSNYFNDDFRARADELGMEVRQVLILASMIEKETSIDKERAAISSVIHNSINTGLLSLKDLPKVPLCSPGKASIEAALYPEESEYLYYVLSSNLDGSHVFATTEEEYQQLLYEYNEARVKRNLEESGELEASEDNTSDDNTSEDNSSEESSSEDADQ